MKGTQPASAGCGEREEGATTTECERPLQAENRPRLVASEEMGASVLKPQGIHSANNLNE